MPKDISSFELTLDDRPRDATLTKWLHDGLRHAILDGRLRPGTRLPATRDFARQYGVSRGTAVTVFDQLLSDGYLRSQVGSGTWVNELLPQPATGGALRARPMRPSPPGPLIGLKFPPQARPFRLHEPAMAEFPAQVWARVASRRMRRLSPALLVGGHPGGHAPLREAIAGYLASARGVKCSPDQIVVTSGVQQGLDILARLLVGPGDSVWMEDPGYFGAAMAFGNAGANMIPVPVDGEGLSVARGIAAGGRVKCVYVTPAHQFPLGMAMSIERRVELLAWAAASGVYIIEDDYDSEFRFEGRPVPALQGLDRHETVVHLGTFNKLLFPALRMGYAVLPPALAERFLELRYGTELHGSSLDQAVLCDFIVEGHLGRHIRRMRELYGARLEALLQGGREYLAGLLEISRIQAGLYTMGYLRNGMTSQQAESAATEARVETMGLYRFTRGTPAAEDGLLLGFAAFDEQGIRKGLASLAGALSS
ncbi:MAG TPA: PLP-dependent aminotransferase family protein [Bryobacteraceae bacterium]